MLFRFAKSIAAGQTTIPAEVRQDHELNILYVGIQRKVVEKSAKGGGVQPVLIENWGQSKVPE